MGRAYWKHLLHNGCKEKYGQWFYPVILVVPRHLASSNWPFIRTCRLPNHELLLHFGKLILKNQNSTRHPSLVIVDKSSKTRYEFLSAYEGDKQQLQWFYNACRGISQHNSYVPVAPLGAAPTPNPSHQNSSIPATSVPPYAPVPEDVQLAMWINASFQSALAEGVPVPNAQPVNLTANANVWDPTSENTSYNDWAQSSGAPPPPKLEPTPDPYNRWSGVGPSSSSPQLHTSQLETPTVLPSAHKAPPAVSVPSTPPIVEETFYGGPIQYPTIDSSPVDLIGPAVGSKPEPVDSKVRQQQQQCFFLLCDMLGCSCGGSLHSMRSHGRMHVVLE